MEHTVIHDEKVDRFEVFESGQIAYLQYDEKNRVLDILHTIVPPQLEGQGIAQALTEAAVRYASVVGLKIRPTCWHYKIFCVNGNTGFRNESRIFYFIHLQNEEDYERKESSSA